MFYEFAFHCFLLVLTITIGWFCNMKRMKNTRHQKVFRNIVRCVYLAIFAKLITLMSFMDVLPGGIISYLFSAAMYCSMMHIWPYLYELSYDIVNQDSDMGIKKHMTMRIPLYFALILFTLNPFFHFLYRFQETQLVVNSSLFYFHIIIAILYSIPSYAVLIKNRKYLPKNLLICTLMLLALFSFAEIMIIMEEEALFMFSISVLALLILLFLLLAYEKFWDPRVSMMNKRALKTYLNRCVERNIHCTLFMIKIVGYQFLEDTEFIGSKKNIIEELHMMIKKNSPVHNLYYVDSGRMIVACDERDRLDEGAFLEQLREKCDREFVINDVTIAMNIDIYILHMPKDLKSVGELEEYLWFNLEEKQIRDMEEKVLVYQGEKLNVSKALRVKKVEMAIQKALEESLFTVYYQPIYTPSGEHVYSAEALIRLKDPVLGYIAPDEFIPIAEKNGSIIDIGLYVFEQVCQFWHNEKPYEKGIQFLDVNFSMEQFMDDFLCEKLEKIMDKYEVPKSALNLEITETAIFYEEVKLRRQMKLMSERGFLFSLDDYGTGYSNMESVVSYPLEFVKLDKSIVWSSMASDKYLITMEYLIQVFHNLDMKIVAEGVETKEQRDILLKMGCDYIQGYLYSKPLSKEEFMLLLSS